MKIRSVLWVGFITMFSACGGAKQAPLTDAQKAEVRATTASANEADSATIQAKKNSNSSPVSAEIFGQPDGISQDSTSIQMAQKLSQASSQNLCKLQVPDNIDPSDPLSKSMSVTGEQCPIYLNVDIQSKGTPGSNGYSMSASIDYHVNPDADDFRKLNDVDIFKLSMTASVSANTDSAQLSAQGTGSIHSQKYGNVAIAMNSQLSMNKGSDFNGSSTTIFTFQDFTAEFKSTTDGKNTKYFVNDQEASLDEYTRLSSNLAATTDTGNGASN